MEGSAPVDGFRAYRSALERRSSFGVGLSYNHSHIASVSESQWLREGPLEGSGDKRAVAWVGGQFVEQAQHGF